MKNMIILSALIVAAATVARCHPTATASHGEIDYATRKHYCGQDLVNIMEAVCNQHDAEGTSGVDEIPDEFPGEDVHYNDESKASVFLACCLQPCYPELVKSFCEHARDDVTEKGTGTRQRNVMRPMYENYNIIRMVKVMRKLDDSKATGSKSEKSATDENKKATKVYNKPINAKAEEAAERMAAINKKYLIVEEGKIVVTSAVDSKHLPKF